MSARWWAFAVWAAVAASAVYWGLQLFVGARPAPPHATVAVTAAAPRGDVTRVLGSDPPPPPVEVEAAAPESARFQLVGTVAARGGGQGLAVIVIDGKTARTFRVGAPVDGETVLQSVGLRSASLGPRGGNATMALDIPPPAPASTGVLPGAVSGAAVQQSPIAGLPLQQPAGQPNAANAPNAALRQLSRPMLPQRTGPGAVPQPNADGMQRNQPDAPASQ